MEQTFSDLCNEHRQTGKGLFGFVLWIFAETAIGICKEHSLQIKFSRRIYMSPSRSNMGSLIAGVLLILFGAFSLTGQLFRGFHSWEVIWPFFVVAVGALFFVAMFAGGKSVAGLAIPGSLFTILGLMLFLQNLFGYWESWAYGWTVIVMSVGLGIFIMGWYAENLLQRASGLRVLKIGAVLFVIFGAFFESIFNSLGISRFIFPVALILLGVYLLTGHSGISFKEPNAPAEIKDSSANSVEEK